MGYPNYATSPQPPWSTFNHIKMASRFARSAVGKLTSYYGTLHESGEFRTDQMQGPPVFDQRYHAITPSRLSPPPSPL